MSRAALIIPGTLLLLASAARADPPDIDYVYIRNQHSAKVTIVVTWKDDSGGDQSKELEFNAGAEKKLQIEGKKIRTTTLKYNQKGKADTVIFELTPAGDRVATSVSGLKFKILDVKTKPRNRAIPLEEEAASGASLQCRSAREIYVFPAQTTEGACADIDPSSLACDPDSQGFTCSEY